MKQLLSLNQITSDEDRSGLRGDFPWFLFNKYYMIAIPFREKCTFNLVKYLTHNLKGK